MTPQHRFESLYIFLKCHTFSKPVQTASYYFVIYFFKKNCFIITKYFKSPNFNNKYSKNKKIFKFIFKIKVIKYY